MYDNVEEKPKLEKMTDKEIVNELYSMQNLAISLYRNDEGTEYSKEYQRFHQYLKLLKMEASRRGIYKGTE